MSDYMDYHVHLFGLEDGPITDKQMYQITGDPDWMLMPKTVTRANLEYAFKVVQKQSKLEPRKLYGMNENDSCPDCGEGFMVVRTNNFNGEMFLGCSRFPNCRKTAQLKLSARNIKAYDLRMRKEKSFYKF